jgi:hypothetical protein
MSESHTSCTKRAINTRNLERLSFIEGWEAFSKAHQNMDKIQLYMQLIPTHIRTAIDVLETAPSARIIERVLPRTIRELERISSICVVLSQNSSSIFLGVMKLLSEVIGATTQSKGAAERRKETTEMELYSSRILEAQIANRTKIAKEAYIAAQEKTREAYLTYKGAVRAIPTGFDKFLEDFGSAINNVITEVGPIVVASVVGGPVAGVAVALRSREGDSVADTAVPLGSGEGDMVANTNAQLDLVETANFAALYRSELEKLSSGVKKSSTGTTTNTSINLLASEYAKTTFNVQLNVSERYFKSFATLFCNLLLLLHRTKVNSAKECQVSKFSRFTSYRV